ncbi:Csu type fimbrial protein [Sphingosinicella xenopeptidilytica]|uniref:Spore coat U domain-containing protein n=1 Tax=Sphingosinicella xenopeptidilytica TaxID=364098 RepID=A0ABW3C2I7_SPHXN
MRALGRVAVCGLLPMLVSTPFAARAATGASFQVSATIEPGCLVDGLGTSGNAGVIGTLDFGTDSALSTATHTASVATTQAITLRCTPGVALAMSIDGGDHAAGSTRHLQRGANPAEQIAYSVCGDAACTAPIAIGGSVGITVTAANMNDIRLPVFGRLTLPGGLPAGTYSDVLTVTLTW